MLIKIKDFEIVTPPPAAPRTVPCGPRQPEPCNGGGGGLSVKQQADAIARQRRPLADARRQQRADIVRQRQRKADAHEMKKWLAQMQKNAIDTRCPIARQREEAQAQGKRFQSLPRHKA